MHYLKNIGINKDSSGLQQNDVLPSAYPIHYTVPDRPLYIGDNDMKCL